MRKQVLVALAAVLAAALPVGVGAQSSTMSGLAACTGNELTAADLLLVDDEATTSCKLTGAELAASALMDIWVDEAGDNVAFLNITDTTGNSLVVDTTTLVVDATNNRVGIGTAAPAEELQVTVPADNTGRMRFTESATGDTWDIGGGAGDSFLIFDPADAAEFILTAGGQLTIAGRMGVADANPDYNFEVFGSAGGGYVGVTASTDGDIFEIDSNGDVGIGTNTPAQRLHVKDGSAGTITFTNPGAVVETNANTTIYVAAPDANAANIAFADDTLDISCEISNAPSLNKFRIVCLETDTDIWLEPDRDIYMQLDVPGTNKVCIQTIGIGTICDYGLLVTAPTTCTVGDTYTDTSPAKCWCSATNTWSVIVGSTCT